MIGNPATEAFLLAYFTGMACLVFGGHLTWVRYAAFWFLAVAFICFLCVDRADE